MQDAGGVNVLSSGFQPREYDSRRFAPRRVARMQIRAPVGRTNADLRPDGPHEWS